MPVDFRKQPRLVAPRGKLLRQEVVIAEVGARR